MKLLKLRFFYFLFFLFSLSGFAQDLSITGNVTDENGLPVPGATISVKGTANGVNSDIDGNYQIMAPSSATLVYSFIGYATQEMAVNGQARIDVSLVPSTESLDEVVVVGYGTQKKSVVTGAISSVKAAQLENMPLTRIEQSLQGRTSGVFIAANAGQPGSAATVRVRGITTFNNNNPLWVVDGILVENGAIGFLNQSDIESIEVLKDAASQAIYGARSAAGVILITTKKGKSGKISVSYNGFTGFSSPARKIDLLDARQYAALRNEAYVNSFTGGNFDLPFPNASSLGSGTDWQDVIFNDSAQRTQHELSFSGGSEKSTFYMSFGLTDQEGIVMSQISKYSRKNIRINSTHKIGNYVTIGQTAGYARAKSSGIGNTNNEYGGPLASAINLDPTTPAIVSDPSTQPNASEYLDNQFAVKDANGNYYGISPHVMQEMTNPLAYAYTRRGNYDWSDDFVTNAYVEVAPIDGLKVRSTVTGKLSHWGYESFTPQAYLNPNNNIIRNNLSRGTNRTFAWNIENTVSYSKLVGGHNFTVLLGQGTYVDAGNKGQFITYYNQPTNDYRDASFNWGTPSTDIVGSAYTNPLHRMTSLFARATYDYKEKYLFTGVIRRDGSSRFGSNNKYGVFPSVSAGWVITKEDFWKENNVVNTFKLRAGYGVTGNDGDRDHAYLALIDGGRNYTIGTGSTTGVVVGNSPAAPSNPDLKWEETTQTNIGFDAVLFNDFTLTMEYFRKETDGILMDVNLPGYVGSTGQPTGNVGGIKNDGIELELGYRKQIGELTIGLNGNVSKITNKVTNIGMDKEFFSGASIQSSNFPLTRAEIGSSYLDFYGFVVDGVFQNQAEIDAGPIPSDRSTAPVPGDFRYKDLNGDGTINSDDRTYLGSPLPDYTFGFTINLEYKNFDFTAFAQGVAGNKIYQGLRRLDMINANWQTNALNRWNGEGTSNSFPRVTENDANGNFSRPSNFFLQDGDYLRLKILQLGYSLPQNLVQKIGMGKVRVYVTGENLLTFTKYTGFDPEIGGGNDPGIDRGYYPQAKSVMFGCNLTF